MKTVYQHLKKPLHLPAIILGVSMLSAFGASASDTDVNPSAPNITASAATKLSTAGYYNSDIPNRLVTTSNTVPMTPITFSNSGGTITRYEISPALSDGITLNTTTGVISGIPKEFRHQTTYTVTAYGTGGSSSTALVQLTVYHGNPSIENATASKTLTIGAKNSITPITFVNSGGLVNYCMSVPALPAGLVVNPTKDGLGTCEITGTPTTGTSTAMTYTIWAANVYTNGSDTATVSIKVNNPPPSAPTNLVATPVGGAVGTATADAVTLTWNAVAGATGYKVYRSTQSMADSTNADPSNLSGLYSATSTPATGTTHTTATLDGKTYYFFVTALNGTLESDTNAAQASAIPFATVTSPNTNRVWMSRNLGATQECTDSKDVACYGDLYQWGRAADGHQRVDRTVPFRVDNRYRRFGNCWNDAEPSESVDCLTLETSILATSITDTTPGVNFILHTGYPRDWLVSRFLNNGFPSGSDDVDENGVLRSAAWADGGVNDVCPAGFSVPTIEELTADTTGAPSPRTVTNKASAFASFLKLPFAGYRIVSYSYYSQPIPFSSFHQVNSFIILWSRSRSIGARFQSDGISFNQHNGYAVRNNRTHGKSIRCIKAVAPILADVTTAVIEKRGTGYTNIIFDNTGGAPATCTVSPALPTGLVVGTSNCAITGVPSITQSATTYTVTGTNSQGSDTATVSLTVN